jgi:hypothetical protein
MDKENNQAHANIQSVKRKRNLSARKKGDIRIRMDNINIKGTTSI